MTASVFIATSVDGFIARENGALDWLPGDDVEEHGYTAFMATIDALVMGRKTYETVLGFGVWPFEKQVIVLTSRPELIIPPTGARCEAMSGSPEQIVNTLSRRGLSRLYIDGGVTIQRFLAAGLIQRLVVTRIPVLLGAGIPLFGRLPHDIRLEHVETRSYRGGLVQSEYRIGALGSTN